MKKTIRWFLIIGLICCLMGVGLITAGAMMGGVRQVGHYIRNSSFYHEIEEWDEIQMEYENHDRDEMDNSHAGLNAVHSERSL